jgi:UDP-N-acetylmuramyl pentapeptide phosphotransferase/UDP-N-acetylglucosamine-1-phosphate transferase
MDGINGMTGGYSLLTLLTFWYLNNKVAFTSESLIIFAILSLLVFNFFNFRSTAKCFAGDVGSISMAFIICFLLAQLIFKTQDLTYGGLLFIYGLDTVSTILFRLIRKENIFEAHRSHFYQYLANERSWPHLKVSMSYCLAQLAINLLLLLPLIGSISYSAPIVVSTVMFVGIAVMGLRIAIEGRIKLTQRP